MATAFFDDSEIEVIREICRVPTRALADLESRLDGLNKAQADACEADIRAWNKIKYGTTAVVPTVMKGTQFSLDKDRDLITNRVRERLNYAPLIGDIGANEFGAFRISVGSADAGDPYCDGY